MFERTNGFFTASHFLINLRFVFTTRRPPARKCRAILLKCGCCDKKVEIYYDNDGLEINGVNGTIEDWREITLPLLLLEQD